MKSLVVCALGAVIAIATGLYMGNALRGSGEFVTDGPRQDIVKVGVHKRSAVDDWQPSEGAPPPYVPEAPTAEDIEAKLTELFAPVHHQADAAPADATARPGGPPDPVEPYLPSTRGDILAGVAYGAASAPAGSENAQDRSAAVADAL